jgi:hypothetical protein
MSQARAAVEEVLGFAREAGTPDAERARRRIADCLESLGYEVRMQRFSFQPGSLRAFPLFGAGLGWLTLIQIPLLASGQLPAWAALAAWLTGLAALGVLAVGAGLGWAAVGAETREDANLVATRPGGTLVRRWIVAHADSKAQGHSMAGRLVAVWAVLAAILALTVLGLLRLAGPLPVAAVAAGAALALVAGALASQGRLRGTSVGARDNGTGLLAALTAAEASTDPSLGILVTGAEEFGLVGARYFAQQSAGSLRGTDVVNCDTLDQEGTFFVVSHDRAGAALATALLPRLAGLGLPVRHRRLPVGIFVDSHPLGRAGARAVTLGRLTWGTLRLLHTPRDTAIGLDLDTAERTGRTIARAD